jgi:hypothetical protein
MHLSAGMQSPHTNWRSIATMQAACHCVPRWRHTSRAVALWGGGQNRRASGGQTLSETDMPLSHLMYHFATC